MYSAPHSILKVLAYYNIFSYPLTKEEIISFLDANYNEPELNNAFKFLLTEKIIFPFDEFYSLCNNPSLIITRKIGNQKAIKQLKIAKKVAILLSHFPYVRGVAVSGSLSKHFADDESDIDFFIITAKNRLWIARTFMHLFKKITFLVGKQNWFCMNYYVDETAIEIREKNIFTATEVITAIPLLSIDGRNVLVIANKWVKNFFPKHIAKKETAEIIRKGFLKSFAELFFNNQFGNWLDDWLMKLTIRRWRKKTKRTKKSRNRMLGMDAGKHYSKPEPRYFQEKMLNRFNLKMQQLSQELESVSRLKAVQFFYGKK